MYHDIGLDTDITIKGKNVPGGEQTLSEAKGQIEIRWELWSDKKDQKIINTSIMKRAGNNEQREQFAKDIMEKMSVQ